MQSRIVIQGLPPLHGFSFRAYFIALFAQKEYIQLLDRISKVNKSLRADRTNSQFPPGRSFGGPLRSSAIYAISVVFQATRRLGAFPVCLTSVPVGVFFPLFQGSAWPR